VTGFPRLQHQQAPANTPPPPIGECCLCWGSCFWRPTCARHEHLNRLQQGTVRTTYNSTLRDRVSIRQSGEVFRRPGTQDSMGTNPSQRRKQMEGQQPAEERAEVIQALLILATNDPDFRRDVKYAPASTLSRYGFTLRNEEMDGVFSYLIRNAGLSDEEILRDLESYLTQERRWR
jgi:hypothetical protein